MQLKELTLVDVRETQLSMLKFLSAYCDENNLEYFLYYGTLIGAVRHQGYIPWDDDIDVAMPRVDYEQLLRTYNVNPKEEKYFLVSPQDENSCYSYAKLIDQSTIKIEKHFSQKSNGFMGIDIDIFPIDRLPASKKQQHRLFRLKMLLYRMDYFSVSDVSMRTAHGKLYSLLCKKVGHRRIIRLSEKLAKRFNHKTTGRLGINACLYNYEREWHREETFARRCKLQFEDSEFWAPHDYHEILTDIYGDYMRLPPENERESTHEYKAYWRNK